MAQDESAASRRAPRPIRGRLPSPREARPRTRRVPAVSAIELRGLLAAALGEAGFPADDILRPAERFDDGRYFLPTALEVEAWMQSNPTRGLVVEPDLFDCDDFAYVFRGHCAQRHLLDPARTDTLPPAVGMLWGSGLVGLDPLPHVVNLVVLADRTVRLIDTVPGGQGRAFVRLRRGCAREIHYVVI